MENVLGKFLVYWRFVYLRRSLLYVSYQSIALLLVTQLPCGILIYTAYWNCYFGGLLYITSEYGGKQNDIINFKTSFGREFCSKDYWYYFGMQLGPWITLWCCCVVISDTSVTPMSFEKKELLGSSCFWLRKCQGRWWSSGRD